MLTERSSFILEMADTKHKRMNREKMIWILLIYSLTSSVCVFAATYQAEEDENITIVWDGQIQADMSLINIICIFNSNVSKMLYKIIRGVEDSESQHEQFAGRVQWDRDALRRGRIRLHLSRLRAEDSGNYRCDLAVNYDNSLKRWELMTSEHFVLNVAQKSEGSPETAKPGLTVTKAEQGTSFPLGLLVAAALLVLVVLSAVLIAWRHQAVYTCEAQTNQNQDLNSFGLLIERDNEEDLFN